MQPHGPNDIVHTDCPRMDSSGMFLDIWVYAARAHTIDVAKHGHKNFYKLAKFHYETLTALCNNYRATYPMFSLRMISTVYILINDHMIQQCRTATANTCRGSTHHRRVTNKMFLLYILLKENLQSSSLYSSISWSVALQCSMYSADVVSWQFAYSFFSRNPSSPCKCRSRVVIMTLDCPARTWAHIIKVLLE